MQGAGYLLGAGFMPRGAGTAPVPRLAEYVQACDRGG
jgi:hypothetical protein